MRLALSCTADIWCGWATAVSILLAADIQQVVVRRVRSGERESEKLEERIR